MNWAPTDLVSDADLTAYESKILTSFNVSDWAEKRRRALEDWLGPILQGQGFDLKRLRTRFDPSAAQGFTGAAYTDVNDKAADAATDDIDVAAIFATVGTDALYIGFASPFRGLSFRVLDSVSAVASVLSVSYWADAWTALTITDGTTKTTGKTFSGGGAVTWNTPIDWVARSINDVGPYYWVKLTVSATPTNAKVSQIGIIQRSILCAPAALRTLTLIMREAPTGAQGPWLEKAAWYETEADAALQRALPLIGGEFDTDKSDQVSPAEAVQTESEVAPAPFKLERA